MIWTCGERKGTLANIILQGKVAGERSRGRPARQWMDGCKGMNMHEM